MVVYTPGKPLPKGQVSQYEASRPGTKKAVSSYSSVKEEREEILIKKAASGEKLTSGQESELRSRGIIVSPDPVSGGVVVTRVGEAGYGESKDISGGAVKTQERPTYKEVIEERNRMIIERNKELALQKTPSSSEAEDINKGFKEAGVSNAQEFFEKTKTGEITESNGQYLINMRKEEQVSPGIITSPPDVVEKSKIRKAYEASPIPRWVEGFKFAFSKKPGYEYSDIPVYQESLIKYKETERVGKSGFGEVLVMGGLGITARPLSVKDVRVDVKSKVSVVQRSSPGLVETEARVVSVVERPRSFLGVTLKPKVYGVAGTIRESARETGFTGLKSGELIYGTSSSSRFVVKEVKSGKLGLFETESVGGEVGGVGQRKTVSVVSSAVRSDEGVVGVRQKGVESFVESYSGVRKDDGKIVGGIVSRKGSGVYVGERVAEINIDEVSAPSYYDPVTGLESVTPTLGLRQESVPVNVKYYNVLSAGQSEVPFSAGVFRGGVRGRLLGEKRVFVLSDKDVSPGFVSDVAREQLSVQGGSVGVSSFDVNQMVARSVTSVDSRSGLVVIPFNGFKSSNAKLVQESVPVIKQRSAVVSKDLVVSRSANKSNIVIGGDVVVSDVKVSNIAAQKGVSELKIGQVQSPAQMGATELKIGQVQSPAQKGVSELKIGQVQSPVGSSRFAGLGFSPPNINVSPGRGFGGTGFVFGRKAGGLFSVDVRRRGKFITVASGVSLSEAQMIGKREIGGSAAASYRVVPLSSGGFVELKRGFGGGLGRGLYASKREEGVIIEKPGFRIKSSGEKYDIPGAAARKRKKVFGGLL